MTANKEKNSWKSKINRKTQLALLAEFIRKEGNMNTNLASFIVGLIIDENDRFTLLQKDGQTYALAKEEGQHTVGDTVKGFAYTDMKQNSL